MMCLYFLKGSSGFIKIGRSSNFDKRLSEIRRGTTDERVEVLKVFYGDDEYIRTRERELHLDLGQMGRAAILKPIRTHCGRVRLQLRRRKQRVVDLLRSISGSRNT